MILKLWKTDIIQTITAIFSQCYLLSLRQLALQVLKVNFDFTKVSASEVPAILKKFILKETTSEAASLKLSWQPGHVYVMSFRPTQNWQERENLQLTWHQSQGQQNLFFPSDYHFTILNVFSLEFGAHLPRIIWLKSSYNPECLSDRMMSQEHGLAAEYR